MSQLVADLTARYAAAAPAPGSASPDMSASMFAPAGAPDFSASATPAVPGPDAWFTDWSKVPPNVKPEVHAGFHKWDTEKGHNSAPKDAYAKMLAQGGGRLGDNWLVDPAGASNPIAQTELAVAEVAAAAAPPAAQATAVNPPALGSSLPATPVQGEPEHLTAQEIARVRALLNVLSAVAQHATSGK